MNRLLWVILLVTVVVTMLYGELRIQTVLFPVSGPFVKPVTLCTGANLVVLTNPLQMQCEVAIFEPFLYADPVAADGDAAVAKCVAGTTQPISDGPFGTPNCENWRIVGIRQGAATRFWQFMNGVPAAQITAAKLQFVQPQ